MNLPVYLVNGNPGNLVPITDRAVQFGDGVFETFLVEQGRAQHLKRHMTRLRHGCRRLGLEGIDFKSLQNELQAIASQEQEGVLKLIVSRGYGTRGYRAITNQRPSILLGMHPLPAYNPDLQSDGIRARICNLRLARQPALAGIKHLNRLEQVLARAEWDDEDIHEGLLLDSSDQLVEGTMSNLFLVRKGQLITADLRNCGVSGIMRSVIMDAAETLGLDTRITALSLSDVDCADELFISNCVIGICPIRKVDGIREYSVGPLVRKLIDTLRNWDDLENERWYST
jgi:4-amino-4-deoxychorismate lyase